MKLAFSATGTDLDAEIDPRFGRCAYFIVVDPDDMSFEAFENESMSLGGGAGVQSAQFVASKGASVVITGNIGPNASRTLSAAGLEVFVGVGGSIREAIQRYTRGELSPAAGPNVSDHYGMGGGGKTPPPGSGMGRGMGMGRDMGIRRGMSRGMGMQKGYDPNKGGASPPRD
ncbi:MAG: NifB/NifX family molybdenum-iron cluster-binding protein [Deltaproteobacteria bacterium]|nr:MAG: NifB/NifX family molybdenum-iron cluster-binding protein [Deltaproteobacteria bacterium]